MAFITFPTSKDIYIEIDGRRLATAQSLSLIHIWSYLDSLLTYGNAVGEIVAASDGRSVAGLYICLLYTSRCV